MEMGWCPAGTRGGRLPQWVQVAERGVGTASSYRQAGGPGEAEGWGGERGHTDGPLGVGGGWAPPVLFLSGQGHLRWVSATIKASQRRSEGTMGSPALPRLSGVQRAGGPGVPSLPHKPFRKSRCRRPCGGVRAPGGWGPGSVAAPKGAPVCMGGRGAQEGLEKESSGERAGRRPDGEQVSPGSREPGTLRWMQPPWGWTWASNCGEKPQAAVSARPLVLLPHPHFPPRLAPAPAPRPHGRGSQDALPCAPGTPQPLPLGHARHPLQALPMATGSCPGLAA